MNVWRRRRPLHIAHQGGELEAPSSTLYAMRTAIDNGADALELDVHATADGHLVVLHDPTVDRTTNGEGRVDQLPLDDVQRLDAAHWFVPDAGVVTGQPDEAYVMRGVAAGDEPPPTGFTAADFRVPTLAEVFTAFPDVLINVDIKQTAPATRPYEQTLADLIAEFDRTDRTMVASFFDEALAAFREIAPGCFTSAGPAEVLAVWSTAHEGAPAPAANFSALQVPRAYGDVEVVTREFVTTAHDLDLAVHVWTVDDAAEMHALLDLGVEGVVTNRPTVLEQVLRSRNQARGTAAD